MRGRTGLYDTADIQQYVRAHKVGAADVAQGIAETIDAVRECRNEKSRALGLCSGRSE